MQPFRYIALLILLTGIGFSIQSCRRKPGDSWTKDDQKSFYNKLYTIANTVLTTETDKKAFADCGLEKAESLLSNGPQSVSKDSLDAISFRIGKSCIVDIHPAINIWNPQIEKALKGKLMEYPTIRNLKPEIREAFCDCYLDTVKKLYPNGITGALPTRQQNEIAVSCFKKVNKGK